MKKLRVAIIGQGRSGRDIHGRFYRSENNHVVDVAVVVEKDPDRRERALQEYPGCEVLDDYTKLFGRTDIDLVVNSSYSQMHYAITKDLLEHKLNVVVEKPFGRNYYECCDLMETAKRNNAVLAVFQQSNLAPIYLDTKAFIESGKLGEIQQISIRYNSLSRRWDWQTLQCKCAGGIYNTGPHPIGFALGFLGFDDNAKVAFSKLSNCLASGDSDDYAKVIISAPGKPVVDIEISNIDAYNDHLIRIQGSKGTYQCNGGGWKAKYIVDGENPERPVIMASLKDENGNPMYCREKLITHEEEDTFNGSPFDVGTRRFYEMMHAHIFEGKPMVVTPEMAAKVIGIIETVHAQNPLPVKFQ